MRRALLGAALPALAVAIALGLRGDASPPGSGSLQRFDVALLPGRGQLVVVVSKEGLGRLPDARAEVELWNAAGALVRTGALPQLEGGVEAVTLATRGLAPGRYRVAARLRAGARLLYEERREVVLEPRPEWLGNALGRLAPQEVPPPWTPIAVHGAALSLWNREYRFEGGLLPTAIASAGAQLLSAPMRLTAELDGRALESGAADARVVTATPARVELETRGSIGRLLARTQTSVEFDGFVWVKLTLEAPAGASLAKLALEVPLRPEHATLYNSDRQDLRGTGATGAGFSTRYDPVRQRVISAWIGDEARGLHWCAESDRGWLLARPDLAMGYERRDGQVLLRIRFVDRPVKLRGPLVLEFGLAATPTRPKPSGYRGWRFGTGDDPGAAAMPGAGRTRLAPKGTNLAYGVAYWSRFPRSRYPEAAADARARLDSMRASGAEPVLDSTLVWTYPLGPEYRAFQDEWHPAPFLWPDLERMNPAKDWLEYPGCPSAPSYADWQLFKLASLLEALAPRGIYFDMSSPTLNGRFASGSGFQDPSRGWPPLGGYLPEGYGHARPGRRLIDVVGRYHPESELLATRELFKRFYVLAKRRDPRFLILLHSSGDLLPGIHSFVDAIVDGEQLRGTMRSSSYEHTLRYDIFRAAFMGHNQGPVALFLPEFSASALERGEPAAFWESRAAWPRIRHLLGLVLLHDSQVIPAYSGLEPYEQVRAAQDEFGAWNEAEFVPYWESARYLRLPPERGLAGSIFRAPADASGARRTLLVVFNDTDQALTSELALDLAALQASGRRLRDLLSGDAFALAGTAPRLSAKVTLPKRDFRMLLLE